MIGGRSDVALLMTVRRESPFLVKRISFEGFEFLVSGFKLFVSDCWNSEVSLPWKQGRTVSGL